MGPGTTSQYNSLFSVSVLGGDSSKTAITVDGGNVRNVIEGDTGMNFWQEVVQEFQLSSANFDLSTGITSVGAVNIVTRTGGNDFHGSGYSFFRDHNMSAYPGLKRDPLSPDPFFARRNPGFWIGGPILKDRLFFFFNYEYMNQTQVFTVQPDLPSVAGLAGNFASPYKGKTISARFDYRISAKSLAVRPVSPMTGTAASARTVEPPFRRTGSGIRTGPIRASSASPAHFVRPWSTTSVSTTRTGRTAICSPQKPTARAVSVWASPKSQPMSGRATFT